MSIFKTYKIDVDTMKASQVSGVVFNQGDRNTAKLVIRLLHDGEVLDLTDYTTSLALLKADSKRVYQDCTITDKENGIVEVVLTTQSLAVTGEVECELSLSFGGDKTIISTKFSFRVEKSIMNASVLSKNDIPFLQNTLEFSSRLGTVSSRLEDIVVNVKDFGTKGDGVTDDTEAIKAAMVYAQTLHGLHSNRRKSVVYFPNGVYIIGEPLVIKWNMVIQGEHHNQTIIRAKANAKLSEMVDTRGSMYGAIRNIFLDGNRTNQGAYYGLRVQGSDRYHNVAFTINTLKAENFMTTGVAFLSPCYGLRVFSVEVRNCGEYGIYDSSTDAKIMLVGAWECGKAGLYVRGANNHYNIGKFSYNGSLGDYTTANVILEYGTRNTFSGIDAQDGKANGFIIKDTFDTVITNFNADCNGDKTLTVSESCGYKLINAYRNIINASATNGFFGLYLDCQYYGLHADKKSHDNIINFVHSRQAMPIKIDNPNNTLNGVHLATSTINTYKYDNKGVLVNKFLNSKFDSITPWQGGYRIFDVEDNAGKYTTTGEYARISQNIVPKSGKTYFFKANVKTSDLDATTIGIAGFKSEQVVKPLTVNEFGDIYSKVVVNTETTQSIAFGLYIIKTGVVGEVKNMICYELPEDLAKLTLEEIYTVIKYNQMNVYGNNDTGLGNGYKLSIL